MLLAVLIFLIAGLAVVTVKTIYHIINQYKCLEDKTIQKYMMNRLNKDAKAKVTTHLGLCEKCQQRLHDYNFSDDVKDHLIEGDNN